MNSQQGFDIRKGTWRCKKCGALNSVGPGDILDLDAMLKRGITEFRRKPLDD